MTSPQPFTPLAAGVEVCASWAQVSELPVDSQGLHTPTMWCVILGVASDVLWSASGRRWRNVEATETVTLDPDQSGCGVSRWGYHYGWSFYPGSPNRVRLPRPDVTAVTGVTLGGSVFTAWRRAGNWVVRTDGCGWPLATSTLITYEFGRLITSGARLAAILLATELGKALAGRPCALPARVTSVTRQGISFEMLEGLEFLKEGLTGVAAVDTWIRTVNPRRTSQAGSVWSPDLVETRAV